MTDDKKFAVDGLVLRGPAPHQSDGNLDDIEMGIFIDDNGDVVFRDEYVTKVLGRDGLTLRELYTKNKGVFAEVTEDDSGNKIEKLFFKDSTVSRAYSLEEIVNLCQTARSSLTNGPLWWVGRKEIDHSQCANVPVEDDRGKPNSVDMLWSVDRFLSGVTNTAACETPTPLSFYEKTIDPKTGEWVWWDVQNLEIVIPPVDDPNKISMILAKLAFTSYNSPEPIIFRLYNDTTKTELTRTAVVQSNSGQVMYPITLNYYGSLTDTSNGTVENCTTEDCGCDNTSCVNGDPACFTPNQEFVLNNIDRSSHVIKVQFHAVNYHPNHWERVFGSAFDGEPLTKSSIDVAIFDINPSTKLQRKHGTAVIEEAREYEVVFGSPLASSNYSLNLTPDKNVKVWFTNKTENGFIIHTSKSFTGFIDWTAIQLN
jgi:hypothetical protein